MPSLRSGTPSRVRWGALTLGALLATGAAASPHRFHGQYYIDHYADTLGLVSLAAVLLHGAGMLEAVSS